MSHRPRICCSKHYSFFIITYRLRALKTLYFYFCKIIKKKKINWNNFCKEFCKKLWKKNNTWNIRCLVDELFVPATQRIILKIVGFLGYAMLRLAWLGWERHKTRAKIAQRHHRGNYQNDSVLVNIGSLDGYTYVCRQKLNNRLFIVSCTAGTVLESVCFKKRWIKSPSQETSLGNRDIWMF